MSRDKISILIADNRPSVQREIVSSLRKYNDAQFEFEPARSGKETIEKITDNSYDLVLMNQELPDKSGIVMLQDLMKKRLGTPVIMIVARDKEKLGVRAMDKGAYDYLTRQEIPTVALNRAVIRALQRKKLEDDIRGSVSELEKWAIRDGLTGLYNQKHLREVLGNEYKKSRRHLQPLSCIMLDLDYFKSVNDNYGHQFGDDVLVQSARILTKLVRDTDFVSRYGGEEFFIILPNTHLNGAYILAERIRSAFASTPFVKGDISQIVTVSIGVVSTSDNDVLSDDDLITTADRALYTAKRKGRNLVCQYENSESGELSGVTADSKKMDNFNAKLKHISNNIKENCIESAHDILRELEKGWDYINEHSVRVSRYAEDLAKELMMGKDERDIIKRAALLHDIGMAGVNSKILRKKGELTTLEYDAVKKHCDIGVKLMETTRLFERELPIILHHHERFDGSGYPNKLKGDSIPFGARMLAVAETYDAITSSTSYRKARSSGDALAELKECAGKQFDPNIVTAFVRVIEQSR